MSFGGQSNAPWQRNMMQGHLQSGGFHQNTQMFMPNSQQNMAAFSHGGMQGGGGNSVAYPQPRSGLNPVAFPQGGGGQSHYNSIGTVTKVSNDCGLINDEVFFYRNVCKGPEPKLGDRVMFEATFSSSGQFKWNATRVQLMQQQQPQPLMGPSKGGYSSAALPNDFQRGQMRHNSPKRSPIRGRQERDRRERERERVHRSRERDDVDERERKRRREEHDRSRDRLTSVNSRGAVSNTEGRGHGGRSEVERDRTESRKKEREIAEREREERERERERERAREKELQVVGSKGRRARAIRRYMVQIPSALLSHKSANIQDLRQRYSNLYIPSDFFHANIKWSETFTPDNPFSLRRPCRFHIMHKQVDPPTEQSLDLLEPADANYLYSAKVMLMSLPPIAEMYKKCFENDDDDIDHQAVHPSRLISFLVGVRGRYKPMAIGGPWSPSLDGENPDKDPSVLIRTAIRTCKALTGIDLSNCTQWYRFVELYYHRTEYKNMEKDGPPRVETVVFYMPDVHSCIPSTKEWQTLKQVYRTQADDIIARRAALASANTAEATDDNDKTNDVEMPDPTLTEGEGEEEGGEKDAEKSFDSDQSVQIIESEAEETQQEEEEKMDDSNVSASDGAIAVNNEEHMDADGAEGEENEEDTANAEEEYENEEPTPEPTHYSLLDLKTMKVQEIRDELLARNLPDKGVRNVVMARLAKALNTEKAEEMRNRGRNKQQQKSDDTKKLNDSAIKRKKIEEKQTDTVQSNAVVDEKNKKKSEKKEAEVKANDEKNVKSKLTDEKIKNSTNGKKDKEEQEDWADIIDFEMSDIVILDEYDSSKNPEVENVSKEMDETEKAQVIRRCTLPPSPQIIVHPNKLAKDGKFGCAIMSLSVLLDYRPDDSKERFFEVSLFAELFNEMLMRDFAFNIYKEIYLYKESTHSGESAEAKVEEHAKKEKNESSDDAKKDVKEKEIKKENKEKEDEKEKSSKKDTKTSNETSNSEKPNKEHHSDDIQSLKSESRKRKHSTSSITNGKDKESSATEKKMVVVKPQLLLSFVYFDHTHCGYIFEKDLEDLFMVIGLNLSRSQIKKVLGKLATRQAIYYRKLTDKEESTESIPCIEDVDDLPSEELQRIAVGNNKYEFVFGNSQVSNQLSVIDNDETEEGLINYNGTVVHVGKLVNQIKRTEKNYSDLEKLYNDILKQLSDLQREHKLQKNTIKSLTSNNKTITRKLTDANQDYNSLNRKYRDQNATLSYIYTRVAPYFTREEDKNKETKGESSRDKEKDAKEKDSDKEKSKIKEEKDDKNKKDDKEKAKPKEDKEKVKDDKEKEKVKDDKEKNKTDEKENSKGEKEKEKVKDDKEKEKEKPKDDKEKEKLKNDKEKEKEKTKDEKEKEKTKDDKEKVKPKDEKEKEKPKDEKEKEKPKDEKEKEKPKDEKEKEKPKDEKEKEKPKDVKEKEKPLEKNKPVKDEKVKQTPNKEILSKKVTSNVSQAKKGSDVKTPGKVIKKADNTNAKK